MTLMQHPTQRFCIQLSLETRYEIVLFYLTMSSTRPTGDITCLSWLSKCLGANVNPSVLEKYKSNDAVKAIGES